MSVQNGKNIFEFVIKENESIPVICLEIREKEIGRWTSEISISALPLSRYVISVVLCVSLAA